MNIKLHKYDAMQLLLFICNAISHLSGKLKIENYYQMVNISKGVVRRVSAGDRQTKAFQYEMRKLISMRVNMRT
jgi:hypothetical protein